jgi:membrane-associated phospholipid phosphatase
MNTRDFLRSGFMSSCLVVGVIFLYPILVIPKGELELLINACHLPFLDVYFKYVTNLGDGSLLAVLLITLLFYKYSSAIITAVSIVIQAVLVSLFKRWIYHGLERPTAFFPDGTALNFVEGVSVHKYNTFPSGHTATAFALFALLLVVINNRGVIISSILFLLAFSVGFSRVYLLQHFVIDAYFGAVFGVLSVVAAMWLYDGLFNEKRKKMLKSNSIRDVLKIKGKTSS